MSLNTCTFIGRLGKDPELKRTQSGKAMLPFSIAVDRDIKNQDGTRTTDWINCVCFGTTAEFIGKYAVQGRSLCVTGRLQVREWETDAGKIQRPEIVVSNAYFADSPKDGGQKPDAGTGYQGGGYGNGGYGGYQNGPNQQGYPSSGYGGYQSGYGGGQ